MFQDLAVSSLAFPAGVAPGFNPAHIAAAGTRFSAVASGGSFNNILSGAVGAVGVGAPVAVITGPLGPATQFAAAGLDVINFTGQSTIADGTTGLNTTMAAIFTIHTAVGATPIIFSTGSLTGGLSIYMGGSTLQYLANGVVNKDSSLPLSVGIPYFVAWSGVGAGGLLNFITKRLDNGIVRTATSTTGTPTAPNGTYQIGKQGVNTSCNSNVSSVMISNQFLSMPTLSRWAEDPWSFWYPPLP